MSYFYRQTQTVAVNPIRRRSSSRVSLVRKIMIAFFFFFLLVMSSSLIKDALIVLLFSSGHKSVLVFDLFLTKELGGGLTPPFM